MSKIEMTIEEIQKELGYKIKIVDKKPEKFLRDVPTNKTVKLGDFEFVVLEHSKDTTALILKEFWYDGKFDSHTHNYSKSNVRKRLNDEFYKKLCKAVGKKNIIKHKVDLTSDDGRKDYGHCYDYISLLTTDLYRRYVEILDSHKPSGGAYWTATAYSTESNGYSSYVRFVDSDGSLDRSSCYCSCGVRPFCIVNSDIAID